MHPPKIFLLAVVLLFQTGICSSGATAQTHIKGSIKMDTALWTPVAYLSIISDFTQMNTMSYSTIIERVDIDQSGNYSFSSEILPQEDHLYRIHFSKKNDPPASLIIGGKEENHFFLIANNHVDIEVKSEQGHNLLNNISFSGYSPNMALREIDQIADYLDTLDYYGTTLNREFISLAVQEKLRTYADTCSHPLVSLYALYNSAFEYDYQANPDFYKNYLKKWKKNKSEYFLAFKNQLPIQNTGSNILGIILILGIIIFPIALFLYRRKTKTVKVPFNSLTVQERRVFSFLQQGLTNKEIADDLGVSLSTVKSHVNNIYSKLNISSRKEVMDYKEK